MAAHSQGSEAYDLSLFEPKKAEIVKLKPNKKLQKQQKRRARVQTVINTAVTMLTAGIVVAVLGLMIASRVQLTEMNSQISQKQSQLNELIGETKRLESELAARTSPQMVEQYAKEQGMQKNEPGQIGYITVNDGGGTASAAVEEPGFWQSIWNAITGFFTGK